MKTEWTILLISAITDFLITFGSSLTAAMVATGNAQMPATAVWILAALTGLVQGARTVQQALKVTPETAAKLKGEEK